MCGMESVLYCVLLDIFPKTISTLWLRLWFLPGMVLNCNVFLVLYHAILTHFERILKMDLLEKCFFI